VHVLAGEKRAKLLGESDRERKLYDTSSSALAGKQSGESFSKAFEKTRQGFEWSLKTQARTQMRALCPPESTQAHTLTQALTLGSSQS